jgi:Domain of unknown function DUF29
MTTSDAPPSAQQECYDHGREGASAEAGVPLATFPPACPWDDDYVLDPDFWPEA